MRSPAFLTRDMPPDLPARTFSAPHLATVLLLFSLLASSVQAQQIGSFFTAIQYNNGALPAGSSSCSNMGGSAQGYCCQSGHSCAWDDSGGVACCASGSSCSGVAGGGAGGGKYDSGQWAGGGAGAGAGAGAGGAGGGGGGGEGCNTCQNVCNTCQEQTTTVYPALQSTYQSTYQQAPTTTAYTQQESAVTSPPSTLTVTPAAGGGVRVTTTVPVNQACGGGGYTTLTQANVGQPVRTVGCFVIFEAAGARAWRVDWWVVVAGLGGWIGWWVGVGW